MIKHLTYVYAILFVLTGGITGCKKNNDIGALTGSISGKYTPPNAAAALIVSNSSGIVKEIRPGDSSGVFNIMDLPTGNYQLGFVPVNGFLPPNPIAVSVAAGSNTDVGTVVFKPSSFPGTGTFGSITGKITPATARTNISVQNTTTLVRYSGVTDTTGNFTINNVSPGMYELSFAPPLQFATPVNVKATVTEGKTTDVGTITLVNAGPKNIDTIAVLLNLFTANDAIGFINRTANDSAIVLLASFYAYREALTPELLAAMKKIIVAKSIFQVTGATGTLMLNGLKEVGELRVIGSADLVTLNVPALSSCGTFIMRDCPALSNVNIGALSNLGAVALTNTGLTGLTAFQHAMFKARNLYISGNAKLSSLKGLNFAGDSLYDCSILANKLLTDLDGLQKIKRFTHEIRITGNPALQSLTGLENAVYARRLTLSDNGQLNNVCAAKVLLNYLKDAPTFTEWQNVSFGSPVRVTREPLVASANGSYATRADLVAAVGLCP